MMMRKILPAFAAAFIAAVPIALLPAQTAASSDSQTASSADSGEAGAESAVPAKKLTAEEKKAAAEKAAAEKKAAAAKAKADKAAAAAKAKADKAEAERRAREKTDSVTEKIYTVEKSITMKRGDACVKLSGNPASFNIYSISDGGVETPVLASYDSSRSTFFSLLSNKTPYRLNREAGVTSEFRLSADSAAIAYTIPDEAQVLVDFSFLSSAPGIPDDIVKVTAYTTNLYKKQRTFSLKAVFDTILGENTPSHFSTAARKTIDGEVQFPSMSSDRWVVSSNGKTAVQFLFDGADCTRPHLVSLGNKDVLSLSSWEPSVAENRSFSSVLAYNNSAIGVNWDSVTLDPKQSQATVFYIVLGANGEAPAGEKYLASLLPADTSAQQNAPAVVPAPIVAPASAPVAAPAPLPAPVPQTNSEPKGSVEFVVPPITDDQLDPEYIQNLIDRINSLQSDPNLVDRTEVRQLSAELDAILAKVRQQTK